MTILVDGTDPYPWPYDGRLGGDHLALVLAGWDEGWAERSLGTGAAAPSAAALAGAVAARGGLVVVLAHRGSEPLPLDVPTTIIAAPAIDGFYASPLDDLLRRTGRTHLLVAGHGIEGPVHSTLRSANDRGYECLLVLDACTPYDAALVAASRSQVEMSGGIFGAVGETAHVLAALAALRPSERNLA
jgi:hypothetical protein